MDWIDEQHKHFFDFANEIIATTEKKELTRDDLLICLSHLADNAFYHFDEEEKYLKDSKHPEAMAHIANHVKHKAEIREMLDYVRNEDMPIGLLADKVASFTSNWLNRHMLGVDKELVQYLKNKAE